MDVRFLGAWRTVKGGEVLIDGTWRQITRAETYRGNAWRTCLTFASPFTISVSPTFVEGRASSFKPARRTVTTDYTQAMPSGGVAPFTYQWASDVTSTNPNSASTAFRATLNGDTEMNGTATVTCTDSRGFTAMAQVDYYLSNQSNQ